MTGVDVAAIRARCKAATPGPWHQQMWLVHSPEGGEIAGPVVTEADGVDDAEFIAHARTDVPALLDALAEAERQRDEALARIDAVAGVIGGMINAPTPAPPNIVAVWAMALDAALADPHPASATEV